MRFVAKATEKEQPKASGDACGKTFLGAAISRASKFYHTYVQPDQARKAELKMRSPKKGQTEDASEARIRVL